MTPSPRHIAQHVLLDIDLLPSILGFAVPSSCASLLCADKELFNAVLPHLWRQVPFKAIMNLPETSARRRRYLRAVREIRVDGQKKPGMILDDHSDPDGQGVVGPRSFHEKTLTSDWIALRGVCPRLQRLIGSREPTNPGPLEFTMRRRADGIVVIERFGTCWVEDLEDNFSFDCPVMLRGAYRARRRGFIDRNRVMLVINDSTRQDWPALIDAVARKIEKAARLRGLVMRWKNVDDAAHIIAAYQASALETGGVNALLTDINIVTPTCTVSSFRQLAISLGPRIRRLTLELKEYMNGEGDSMTALDLPAIVDTLRDLCPALETLDLAICLSNKSSRGWVTKQERPPRVPWSTIRPPAVGLQCLILEINDSNLFCGPTRDIGLMAAIASSLACLTGPRCTFHVALSSRRSVTNKRTAPQSQDMQALVELLRGMDPGKVKRLGESDFGSLGITCPDDIRSLAFDEQGEPLPLGAKRATHGVAGIGSWPT